MAKIPPPGPRTILAENEIGLRIVIPVKANWIMILFSGFASLMFPAVLCMFLFPENEPQQVPQNEPQQVPQILFFPLIFCAIFLAFVSCL